MSASLTSDHDDFFDPELDLLRDSGSSGDGDGDSAADHALRTAPVFTGDALAVLGACSLPQRALYGRLISQHAPNLLEHASFPKIYVNTNAPFSALVCGVQGSGKSHTTSVLLESCLISDNRLGTLPAPLSAIVLHFDTAAGGGVVQPCEAAYLATIDATRGIGVIPPNVTVLVVPTYLHAMKKVYAGLSQVKVEPLLFSPEDISGERLLAMMKVDENTQIPLYMEAIMAILRSMEDNFNYVEFRSKLAAQKFSASQKTMLNLRLSLLDSCMKGGDAKNRVSTHFKPGHLTVIDLSSPSWIQHRHADSLISFSDFSLRPKYHQADSLYLSESQGGSSGRLTESLLTVIRQQRHLATRVIISTQEPTVVPTKYLDLCSFIIAHRFSSPKWLRVLADHISSAESTLEELFDKIVALQTGQAIMFAPNALTVRNRPTAVSGWGLETEAGQPRTERTATPLGQGYFFVHSRSRVTRDGGHSLLAVHDPSTTTRLKRVSRCDCPESYSGVREGTALSQTTLSSTSPTLTDAHSNIQLYTPRSPPGLDSRSSRPSTPAAPSASSISPIHNSSAPVPVSFAQPVSSEEGVSGTNVQPFPASQPTNELVGKLQRFVPLVKYLQIVSVAGGGLPIPTKAMEKRLPKKYPDIYSNVMEARNTIEDAIALNVIMRCDDKHVMLAQGVDYLLDNPSASPRITSIEDDANQTFDSSRLTPEPPNAATAAPTTVHMSGERQRFLPLVEYLQHRKSIGITVTFMAKIRMHFRRKKPEIYGVDTQAITGIITEAIRLHVLASPAPNQVVLIDGAHYVRDVIPQNTLSDAHHLATSLKNGPPGTPIANIAQSNTDFKYFYPIVDYMRTSNESHMASKKAIRRHFCERKGEIYGTDPLVMNKVIEDAVSMGILRKVDDKCVALG